MRQPAEDEGLPPAPACEREPGVTIRRQTLADVPAVTRVRATAWRAAYDGIVPDDFLAEMEPTPAVIARAEEQFTQRGPHVHSFVAAHAVPADSSRPATRAGGAVIGFVVAGPDRDIGPPAGEIWAIYVNPTSWGDGVGKLLLAAGIGALRATGREPINLWVLEQNHRARGFYEHEGFVRTGGRREIVLGEPIPEVQYELRAGR
jgi:GNAT superfamily N-acetyltransferase